MDAGDVIRVDNPSRTYLFGDPHFDHTNIIKYCNRPFKSVEEMNEVILRNWHRTIRSTDLVFFLGDMAFGRGSRKPRWWLSQLTGRIVYLKGSHDQGIRPAATGLNALKVALTQIVEFSNSKRVLLVHDTVNVPWTWLGWVIHGHNHNNRPLVDVHSQHVNVSADVLNYTPISFSELFDKVRRAKDD